MPDCVSDDTKLCFEYVTYKIFLIDDAIWQYVFNGEFFLESIVAVLADRLFETVCGGWNLFCIGNKYILA